MDSEPEQHAYATYGKRHSIDLTLELERQLDDESLPPASPRQSARPESFDAGVLASIITQLRQSLLEATRERDDFLVMLDEATRKQIGLKEDLELVTERSSLLEEQLSAAHAKHKEDEEAISMLRAKVEESRRGLMRLQTENRRVSQLSHDPSRGPGSASAKRMSFILPESTSPNNRGHRRFSSYSDNGFALAGDANDGGQLYSPPISATSNIDTARRYPTLLSMGSAPSTSEYDPRTLALEVDRLQKELKTVKEALEESRHEISESNEAREASEQCVKALRDYIADNHVGEPGSTGSPLLPASMTGRGDGAAPRWSFKLWSGVSGGSSMSSPLSTPATSSEGGGVTSPQFSATSPPALSRKIGSFFGGRGGSISSISSAISQATALSPPVQMPSMDRGGSDASSMEEPQSPAGEPLSVVKIRDCSGSSVESEDEKR